MKDTTKYKITDRMGNMKNQRNYSELHTSMGHLSEVKLLSYTITVPL